ncbi:hypothetical protein DSL92_02705 [Billgrantia gudaonensis]|uniref:Uncharacterized protein n=1 Tax=Billgrantia gudaonensis TaxID=376427 RepID=A0A3S0QG73_9GAMM|nr:hypothetical protein DSL92_02705 [Halomonas gudaonensis]
MLAGGAWQPATSEHFRFVEGLVVDTTTRGTGLAALQQDRPSSRALHGGGRRRPLSGGGILRGAGPARDLWRTRLLRVALALVEAGRRVPSIRARFPTRPRLVHWNRRAPGDHSQQDCFVDFATMGAPAVAAAGSFPRTPGGGQRKTTDGCAHPQ